MTLKRPLSTDVNYFVDSFFNSYSQIFFSDHKLFAGLLVLVTFFDYHMGVMGAMAVLTTSIAGFVINLDRQNVAKGLYGFNGLLVGLGLGVYYALSWELLFIVILSSLFSLFISVAFQGILGKYNLPFLSIPFLLVLWSFTLAAKHMGFLGISERGIYTLNELYLIGGSSLVEFYTAVNNLPIPIALQSYFISLSAILFQYNVLAGFLISIGLLLFSRISFSLSLIGFFIAYGFYHFIKADITAVDYSYIGFNYILTAIAIGGFFLIPSFRTYLSVAVLVPIVAIITISLNAVMLTFRLPIYSLPFNIVVILYLYVLKFRMTPSRNLSEVYYQTSSPEKNLYSFLTDVERFNFKWFTPVKLPFFGVWNVSQGHNGSFTHKDEWRHAWDFVILDNQGSRYKNQGLVCEDYYCFNKPVIAPEGGVVEEIMDGIDDNKIGDVNLEYNWGNTIIIKHNDYVYSKLSHLKKDSIKVKKGDSVTYGQIIASSGNSGHSPYPHLHYQLQAYPYIGSVTLDYPISSYVLHQTNNTQFLTQQKPNLGDAVSNVLVNSLINNAFNFVPGEILNYKVTGHAKEQSLKLHVKVNVYGQAYLFCEKTNSVAYFEKSDNQYYFTQYYGKRSSLLYLMFLACYKVQKGFYKNLVIEDEYPLHLVFPKSILWFHDFISPFVRLVKSKFYLSYDYMDDELSPNEIRLQSKVENRLLMRQLKGMAFNITIRKGGLEKLEVKQNNQLINIERAHEN